MNEWNLELLRQLTAAFGVSGEEEEIRALIRREAEPYVDEMREDALGNLIVHRRGEGRRLMFAAHMDSIGIMVHHIDGKGFLRFQPVGGLEAAPLCQMPVKFKNGTMGVISVNEDKAEKQMSLSDLFVDIGAGSREEAEKLVALGDTAAFAMPLLTMGDKVLSPYLDNRAGCFVLLEALKRIRRPACDLYFVFSVQEEVGCRGAKTAAWTIAPEVAVAVDVTCPDDVPGAVHDGTTIMGKGAALKVMDRSVIASPGLLRQMEEAAGRAGIPVQRDILKCGGTDAGSMQTAGPGAVTGGISIPCRYTHAPTELASQTDIEACVRLVQAMCEGEETNGAS